MTGLRLYLFGPPRLERDDRPLKIPRRKVKALLAYLVMEPQRHSRDGLSAIFWPEYDQRRARADLSRTLSALNKLLGKRNIIADRDMISVNPQRALWTDALLFQQMVTGCEAHRRPQVDGCSDCIFALAEAVRLYKADFLTVFPWPTVQPLKPGNCFRLKRFSVSCRRRWGFCVKATAYGTTGKRPSSTPVPGWRLSLCMNRRIAS